MSQAIKTVEGVVGVDVVFKDKLAHVLTGKKSCGADSLKNMVKALEKAGYQGSVIRVKAGKG